MTEIMPIPAASVAGMIFSLILSFALPIGLLVFLRRRTGVKVTVFLIGGATFFLFAMVLEQLLHTVVLSAAGEALTANIWLYALYGGLAAGLFEETGRYVAMKFFLKNSYPASRPSCTGPDTAGLKPSWCWA